MDEHCVVIAPFLIKYSRTVGISTYLDEYGFGPVVGEGAVERGGKNKKVEICTTVLTSVYTLFIFLLLLHFFSSSLSLSLAFYREARSAEM